MNLAEAVECVEHGVKETVVFVPRNVYETLCTMPVTSHYQNVALREAGVREQILVRGQVVMPSTGPPPPERCERCGRKK